MSDPFASFRLYGRAALVTGARREIGRAIALGLAGAGARLAIHHAGTAEEASDAAAVVREIQAMGGGATQFTLSAGNPSVSATMVDVGAYVQDDWRILPNLTISGGVSASASPMTLPIFPSAVPKSA